MSRPMSPAEQSGMMARELLAKGVVTVLAMVGLFVVFSTQWPDPRAPVVIGSIILVAILYVALTGYERVHKTRELTLDYTVVTDAYREWVHQERMRTRFQWGPLAEPLLFLTYGLRDEE